MPFGLLADRWNRNSLCAAAGCVIVILSYGIGIIGISAAVSAAVIAAGIGNALFHVGGGIDILNISGKKAFLLGVYVSPGALGIFLGSLLGRQNNLSSWFVILALMIVCAAILKVCYVKKSSFHSDNVQLSFQGISESGILIAISCLFAVVFLRSYLGMNSSFPWKTENAWAILLVCAVVMGKVTGGFLADKLGALKTCVISLGLSSVLFIVSNYPLAGIMAVFFFNMTMPITLWALTRILKGSKGFAFGVLTFGLFLGFTPVYFEFTPLLSTSIGFASAAIGSLVLLWFGLRKAVI